MRPGLYAASEPARPHIAVIGAGISGMAAAYALSGKARVTLFEAEPRLGGHARTVMAGPHRDIPVDTGFMVFNTNTYPHLTALFETLEVPTRPTDMSFAVSLDGGAFEYGVSDPHRLLADPRNAVSPRFWRLVSDILRFNRDAMAAAQGPEITLGALLRRMNLSADFRDRYLYPLAGAIWSTARDDMDRFPAQSFVRFFDNHCLLSATQGPNWLTIAGGSQEYVSRLERALTFRRVTIRTGCPTEAVGRAPAPWVKPKGSEREMFDGVVMACHSDQAHALLADPTPEENAVLGALRYRPNRAVLHGDARHMPRRRLAWSSWVYRGKSGADETGGSFTYWMNQLQHIPRKTPLFVTLNPAGPIDESLIYDEARFDHPQFDLAALRAQAQLPAIQGMRNTWFAGAYTRYGFHEDGMASGLAAAQMIEGAFAAEDRRALA